MIEDVKEKNRLKEELTKNTTKHYHAKRKGEGKRKPKNSKSEIYEVWSYLFNTGTQPDWFKHTLIAEDGGKDVDEWYFEWDDNWNHYVVNWEKSYTEIPKTGLNYNTFLTCNENHKKATHHFLTAFNKQYVITGIKDDEDGKKRGKALQQRYKALSKPSFTFPEIENYEECYEAMKKAKANKKTEKTK